MLVNAHFASPSTVPFAPSAAGTPPPPVAGSEAGARKHTGSQRREFEVRTLLRLLPEILRALVAPALLAVAAPGSPWSAASLELPWVPVPWRRYTSQELKQSDLDWLRGMLVVELKAGITLAERPLLWLCRPARNLWLALCAARFSQIVTALDCHPEADPHTDELYRALLALPSAGTKQDSAHPHNA